MNERRLNNMIEAKQDWERQLRLITQLGSGRPGVSKWMCEYRIMSLNAEIEAEKQS